MSSSSDEPVSTVIASAFTLSLGTDAALLLRTPALADSYHELLVANQLRLARWERWAAEPMTLDGTRSFLDEGARGWLDGTQLPAAIAVTTVGGWQLVGSAGLRINRYAESAEVGYWIDARYEGRGLVTRAVTALLDHAFGPLLLHRIELRTDLDNERSRAVAVRLGFRKEGLQHQAIAVGGSWRDDVLYGLLADEWRERRASPR